MRVLSLIRDAAFLALPLLLGVGCVELRELPAGADAGCAGCHGTAEQLAPPPSLWLSGSKTETTDREVGAHAAHLGASTFTGPVACESCHVVPQKIDDDGHMDTPLPAEVTFSELARGDLRDPPAGLKPQWDGSSLTCTSTHCHGLSGGSEPSPSWTKGGPMACGSCHGLPPGGSHPQSKDCGTCHGEVVDASNQIRNKSLHVNGKIEVSAQGCSGCHGSADSPAPPPDTQGNSATSFRGVGAHRAHVKATAGLTAPLDCDACHVKPKAVSDPGHMDSALPAEVTFGALAKGELRQPPLGLKPAWDGSSLSCTSTYCHDLDGGGAKSPSWTGDQSMVCGSCHGLPPAKSLSGKTHPASSVDNCVTCHVSVVDKAGKIVAPEKHVNGVVDFN